MTESRKPAPAELAVFAAIDTAERAVPAKLAKAGRPAEPPAEPRPAFTAATIPRFLARKLAGNIAAHLIWMAIVGFFPAKKAAIALCAFVAAQGDWEVKEARAGTKPPGIVARIGEKLKHPLEAAKEAAAKPVEAVKEGAKKAVVKAEEKAEVLREEVKEQAGEVKEALHGLRVEAPAGRPDLLDRVKGGPDVATPPVAEAPGLLDRARSNLAGARDAVTGAVDRTFAGPTAKEIQARRDYLSNQRARAVKKALKDKNNRQLDYIGAVNNAGIGQAVQQHDAYIQQRQAWGEQLMMGNMNGGRR